MLPNIKICSFFNYLNENNILSKNIIFHLRQEANSKQNSFPKLLYAQKNIDHNTLFYYFKYYLNIGCLNDFQYISFNKKIDIPLPLLRKYKVVPIHKNHTDLYVAMENPTDITIQNYLAFLTDLNIKPLIASSTEILDLLNGHNLGQTNDKPTNIKKSGGNTKLASKLINQLMNNAIDNNASDIHFEPYKNNYRVRFRIDGVLHTIDSFSIDSLQAITVRLKILSELDITEKRLPQDGHFRFDYSEDKSFDIRISTCPTVFGEKIVLRILESIEINLDIKQLGLSKKQYYLFKHAIQQKQGMILVTGPTGSGKTITLYSALNKINSTHHNILTIEDPVEIKLNGINQVNIHAKAGLTFAKALRAFLRQDPDIIMVGEIRDHETADIAIKAAHTGHLVLSTLHTSSTIKTITRLLDMGIAAYHLASTINLIIAQRLLRKLCDYCKYSYYNENIVVPDEYRNRKNFIFYKAEGCHQCQQGYRGRIGIFELLIISDAFAQLIIKHADEQILLKHALHEGLSSLKSQAWRLIFQGATSVEEVERLFL